MRLNGIDFGRAWCASGTRNFHGQGWPHHRQLGPLAPDFRGSTLVAKTTTLDPRAGNMPLRGLDPAETMPRCIRVNWRRGAVLNAVGLSGPGLDALLAAGDWQALESPFVLSFMAVGDDHAGQARAFGRRLNEERDRNHFRAPFALQVNASCPNVGADAGHLVAGTIDVIEAMSGQLPGVPLIVKLNALVDPLDAAWIGRHPACAAVAASNTIPWGAMPDRIAWRGLFGEVSPLASFGRGGLSGAPITRIVRDWTAAYCALPGHAPLVAGGGVMTPGDAIALLDLGAAAVEVGSVAILRPWRVRSIIRAIHAHEGARP